VPEELAIVGVDNDPIICELTRPPLSSVRVPWDRLGHELALTVNRLRESGPHAMRPECVRIRPTGVAVRRSSDTVAVADPDVAAALAVIREHAASPIDVPSPSTCCSTPTSRRRKSPATAASPTPASSPPRSVRNAGRHR
jgi:LacI family transcriptional regulator